MSTKEYNQTYGPNDEGRKKIFDSKFAEFFTKTHPLVPIILFIIIGAILNAYALMTGMLELKHVAILLPLGLFFFTFVEYSIHRFVFHMEITNKIKEKIQYGAHGVHHEYPNDQKRLVMPPILSIPIATIVLGVFYLFMGDYAFSFVGGFLAGYGLYLFVHYIVHAWKMPKNRFKTLWLYHNIHHFQNEEVAFGVTSHFWDRVFGTMPKYQTGKTKK